MKIVTLDRNAIHEFAVQWPCHGFPDVLEKIVFEFDDNGDLVDINAYAPRGLAIDTHMFDGPALVALVADAREVDGDVFETPVMFRMMTPRHGGEVVAIFPCDAASYNPHECGSYAHVGQHGCCDPWHVIRHSRPATEAEYADLKAELEGEPYGYCFRVYERMQRGWLEVRKAAVEHDGVRLPPNPTCRERAIGRLGSP